MIPQVPVQPDRGLLEQARNAVLEHGVVQLQGLYRPELLAALHAEYVTGFERVIAREEPGRLLALGIKRLHVTLQARGALLNPAFYAHPFLYALYQTLLDREFIIGTIASATSFPGAPGQHPHRDQELLFHDPRANAACPPASLCLAVPLVTLNAETGATDFALGSHRDAAIMQRIGAGAEVPFAAPVVPLGDALIWDNRIVHRGMPNRSQTRRPLLLVYIQRPWFRNDNLEGPAGLQIEVEELAKLDPLLRPMFSWPHFPRLGDYGKRARVAADSGCPCGSGETWQNCCGASTT